MFPIHKLEYHPISKFIHLFFPLFSYVHIIHLQILLNHYHLHYQKDHHWLIFLAFFNFHSLILLKCSILVFLCQTKSVSTHFSLSNVQRLNLRSILIYNSDKNFQVHPTFKHHISHSMQLVLIQAYVLPQPNLHKLPLT